MAVAVTQDYKDGTLDQYDEVLTKGMGSSRGDRPSPGASSTG